MVRRMLKAGVAQSKALQYEQRALLVTMSEDVISSADVGLLKFALQSTRADAQAIQKCIRELWCATLNSDSELMRSWRRGRTRNVVGTLCCVCTCVCMCMRVRVLVC